MNILSERIVQGTRYIVYSCDHEVQAAYTVGHGRNVGKWIAVCVHCGARSRGRPKSTEAIAHAALTRHPCIEATKVVVFENGHE